jgi:hypothetical protein
MDMLLFLLIYFTQKKNVKKKKKKTQKIYYISISNMHLMQQLLNARIDENFKHVTFMSQTNANTLLTQGSIHGALYIQFIHIVVKDTLN